MGRVVMRVPLDFAWPLDKTWEGYVRPKKFEENTCPACNGGAYSPFAQHLYDQWYGKAPFNPADTGSTPLTVDTPAVRAFAERNVADSPWFYGTGEAAIVREAQRLIGMWNRQWSHHLAQEDVDALVAGGRLMDFTHTWEGPERRWVKIEPPVTPTAAQVNEWALRGLGHDSMNAWIAVSARCKRAGEVEWCATCEGHGSLEAYEGQRAEAEAWERTEPPEGEGYQLWQTVSEGSPITPVFATAEELARHMVSHHWNTNPEPMASSFEVAMRFIDAGWAPSGGTIDGEVVTGVEYVGRDRSGATPSAGV
jgi:hypothetical protein